MDTNNLIDNLSDPQDTEDTAGNDETEDNESEKKATEEVLELKENQDYAWTWSRDKNLLATKARKRKTAGKQKNRIKERHKISNNWPKQNKLSWS